MSFILYLLFCLFYLIKADYEKDCLEVQICEIEGATSHKIKCSKNGKCFYSLFDYLVKEKGEGDFFTCICNRGYVTPNKDDYDSVFCCYKQKRQFYAYILEVIPGLGIGHLYAGRKTMFVIKISVILTLFVVYIVCHILLKTFYNKRMEKMRKESRGENKSEKSNDTELNSTELVFNAVKIVCLTGIIIFQIVDNVLFGLNIYKDGNGVELRPW